MTDVILQVADFGGCRVSIRYDDVTLAIDRVIINNQSNALIRVGAAHRATGNAVWVSCNASQDKTSVIPKGYYLDRDPVDNSITYGQTEVYTQWPGEL